VADGARLKFDVSLRGTSHPALTFAFFRLARVVGAATLALGLGLFACARDGAFQERGLPADLPRYLGQLKALKVPSEVASLAWIPTTLQELDASGTKIESISFVPMGMERLDLHGAKNLKQLPTLPSSIRELDIRFTQIVGPWRFPHELEFLALGGDRVETLNGLSSLQLRELRLEKVTNLQSTAGLPVSLQILSISDATFLQLIELPPQLKELRLENTQVRTLKGLPASLHSMSLLGNSVIEAELPRHLLSLAMKDNRQRLLNLDTLAFLNHLEFQDWVRLQRFPAFLRNLQVPFLRQDMRVPPTVRRLRVGGATVLPRLPLGLEEFTWPEGADLTSLPAGLKHLAIPSSSLVDLSGLPPGTRLESLDVSLTDIPIHMLPDSLLSLRYRFCGFSSLSGLPSQLRSLDLEGSVDVHVLEALPSRLEHLDVSETSITELPALPGALTELDISNTPIDNLQGLRGLLRLRRLTVHAGQLKRLAGLPASVSELRFVDRR